MTRTNYKSIYMGLLHSAIIPTILMVLTKNLLIGLVYLIVPFIAYSTFASKQRDGKAIFYLIATATLFTLIVVLASFGGLRWLIGK